MVNELLWRFFGWYRRLYRWKRNAQLIGILIGHALEGIGQKIKCKITKTRTPTRGERTRLLFERLGPTYIKFAQVLSTRPELPDDLVKELKKLQDEVPPFPYEKVEEQIKSELGAPIEELFLYFEKEPIAAASIGQVHRAVLRNGERVVVKVQRPGIEYLMETDIDILARLFRILEKLFADTRQFNLSVTIEAFRTATMRELDYIIEGRNADRFARLFAKDKTVYIPKVHWDYTSKRVLTLEFIDGIKIDETEELIRRGCNRRKISTNIVRAYMKQIFEGGFFHADPHPANVFVMDNNVIALLDFGMVGRASPKTLDKFADVLLATMQRDVDKIMEGMLHLVKKTDATNLEHLRNDIADYVERSFDIDGKLAVTQAGVGNFMDELILRFAKYRLIVPEDLIYLGKVVMYAEGAGRRLDPEFDIVAAVEPFVRKFAAQKIKERLDPFGIREPARFATTIFEFTSEVADLIKNLPRQANTILDKIEKGEFKIQFESSDMRELHYGIHLIRNHQIAFSIIISALILGFIFVLTKFG
jgi:ubiquinone biosynthesis protein